MVSFSGLVLWCQKRIFRSGLNDKFDENQPFMEAGKPKKIFIVDDDTMLTTALEDYLTRTIAHQIRSFNSGEECLKCLTEEPDIIILDYVLNTVQKDAATGLEILHLIKKHNPSLRVIMLSGQEQYGIATKTIQQGAEQYVVKDEQAFEKISRIINEI
jgi:two-component system OmpR family response regulator